MAFLTWETRAGCQRLELGDVAVLGRVEECDVMLPAPEVSRQHARIRRDAARWLFEDESSRNGSYINGAPSQSATTLTDGDTISVGPFRLTFSTEPTTQPPPLPTGSAPVEPLSAMASLDLSRTLAPVAPGNSATLSRRLQLLSL